MRHPTRTAGAIVAGIAVIPDNPADEVTTAQLAPALTEAITHAIVLDLGDRVALRLLVDHHHPEPEATRALTNARAVHGTKALKRPKRRRTPSTENT